MFFQVTLVNEMIVITWLLCINKLTKYDAMPQFSSYP